MTALKAMVSVYVLVGLLVGTATAVTIDTVPVRNVGNTPDIWGAGYGSVDYEYNIGKYEVTAGQYTAFLNAVAATDTHRLYNTNMWSSTYGCKIQRSGTPGSYAYSVTSDYANRPVSHVSWGDAARFANWLHNGQPTNVAQGPGTTETGAYTLNGSMTDAGLLAVNRNSDWKWAISSEDEWYKAAYHKADGATGNYWVYPTSSDYINTDMANYGASVNHTTDVGAYPYPSPYGTFDQGGNLWEWNEAVIGSSRGLRGGSFNDASSSLCASYGYFSSLPSSEFDLFGFRVSEVPEPTSLAILAFGGMGILVRRTGLGLEPRSAAHRPVAGGGACR